MKKILLSILLSLAVVGCGSEETKTSIVEKKEKVLKVSQGAQPKSLDPNLYNEVPALAITKQIFNTLIGVDKNGNLVPELAEKWEFVDDQNIRISIRDDIKFHNGEKLTVEDVIFSLERALSMPGSRSVIEKIKHVSKIDDKTFNIELETTFAPVLYGLAHPLTAIQNKKYTLEKGELVRQEPLGTGPYKYKNWVSGENIELEAFDDYFLGRPKVDKIIFRVIPENTNRLIALETGEIDIAYGIAPIDVEQIEKDKNLELVSELSYSTEFVQLNNNRAPFNNKKFRQAISSAIDKASIAEAIYLGKATPASTIVNPSVFGSDQNVLSYDYNPEKAKELLAESKEQEKNVKIWVNDNAVRIQVAQIIQANLKEIGLNGEIEILEWGAYLQKSANGEHQMLLGGWNAGTGDADNALFPLLHSLSRGPNGNRSFYESKDADYLIEMAQKTTDVENRKEIYSKAQEVINEDVPLIPIVYRKENIGVSKKVYGFEYKASGHHSLHNIELKD